MTETHLILSIYGSLTVLAVLGLASWLMSVSSQLAAMEQRIQVKLSELTAKLEAVRVQVEKVKAEVQALKDSLADVDLPPEATAVLEALAESVNAVDAINPDAPTP